MILVTGGAGYIGAHLCAALAAAELPFVIFDSLVLGQADVLERLQRLHPGCAARMVEGDVRDAVQLDALFQAYPITSVMHLAGLKSISESLSSPGLYHEVNVTGSQTLLQAMARHGVKTLIFASSASVYGVAATSPITELTPTAPMSPYGASKRAVEDLLGSPRFQCNK